MELSDFEKKVLDAVQKIPKGKVVSYKHIAQVIGCPRACQAVGNALKKNPWAPRVPCHRVVKSDGCVGGYAGGAVKKIKLLTKEGVKLCRAKGEKFKVLFDKTKK